MSSTDRHLGGVPGGERQGHGEGAHAQVRGGRQGERPRAVGGRAVQAGTNCIQIDLPGKSIVGDYFQANRTSRGLFHKISFMGEPDCGS